MKVQLEMANEVAVLIPAGNLVTTQISIFQAQVDRLISDDTRFVLLDMGQVSFMDSSGLDAIMKIHKLILNRGGSMVCVALPENVAKVFRITWADQKIAVAASRDEGVQLLREDRSG